MHSPNGNGYYKPGDILTGGHRVDPVTMKSTGEPMEFRVVGGPVSATAQPQSATQREAQRLAMVSQINAVTKQLNTLTAAYRKLAEDHSALIRELGRRIDLAGKEQDAAKAAHAGFYGAGLWARLRWLVRGGR